MKKINKKIFVLTTLFLVVLSPSIQAGDNPFFSPPKCFPEYLCADWGECVNGLQSRICIDKKCDRRDITERKFCDTPGCKPKIGCLDWSECIYVDKITDLITGSIGFGGYKNRICRDTNGCVESFTEEKPCEEFYPLQLEKTEQCGKNFLVAIDPISEREVAKINLDSWSSKKLDITITQGDTKYCPDCYNSVKDENEESIDCGGECKPCAEKRTLPAKLPIIAFWMFSALFSLLFIRELIAMRKSNNQSYIMFKQNNI
ncbi:MAG: hypothetical protein ABIG28_00970 [archaeon]